MSRACYALLSLVVAAALSCIVSAQSPTPVPAYPATPLYGQLAPSGVYSSSSSQASEASQIAQRYVKANKEEDKRNHRKRLDDVLSEQFDRHMAQQKKELEDLEKQIEQLKATLRKRQDAKDTIVKRRADQLIHEAEGLGWTAPSTPRGGVGSFGGFPGGGGFGSGGRTSLGPTPPSGAPGTGPTPPGKLETR